MTLCRVNVSLTSIPCFTADYKNEAEVGEALSEAFKTGLVKREDLFITTKARSMETLNLLFFSSYFIIL